MWTWNYPELCGCSNCVMIHFKIQIHFSWGHMPANVTADRQLCKCVYTYMHMYIYIATFNYLLSVGCTWLLPLLLPLNCCDCCRLWQGFSFSFFLFFFGIMQMAFQLNEICLTARLPVNIIKNGQPIQNNKNNTLTEKLSTLMQQSQWTWALCLHKARWLACKLLLIQLKIPSDLCNCRRRRPGKRWPRIRIRWCNCCRPAQCGWCRRWCDHYG